MRGVAEEARDVNLAEQKTLVDKRVEQLGVRSDERAEDLRRRSELDVKGIGDWERGEIERIRTDAEQKVEARRHQLEQQLSEHGQHTEREIAGMRAGLADHERELAAFFAQLTEINDPADFVSAAKRMPQAPSLDPTAANGGATPSSPEPVASESLTTRLAQLGIEQGKETPAPASGNGAGAAPASGDATLAERLAQLDEQLTSKSDHVASTTPAAAEGEVTTALVVKGLASFGAITSFKQALEKVEGVRSVTLSLGPSGEFVYRATHDAGFDLDGAIVTLEGASAAIEHQPDGTLRVTVSRPR